MRIAGAVILAALMLTACAGAPGTAQQDQEFLILRTAQEETRLHEAGIRLTDAVNKTADNTRVKAEESPGDPASIMSLREGTADCVLITGETAYGAYGGTLAYEGETPMEDLRAIGAVSSHVSLWLSGKEPAPESLEELKGGCLAVGPSASQTERTAVLLLELMGIDGENTWLWNAGLAEGIRAAGEQTVDAAHVFDLMGEGLPETDAGGTELRTISPDRETIRQMAERYPWFYLETIPAGTWKDQTEETAALGIKVLLCVRADMEEETARELAMSLDVRGGELASDQGVFGRMDDSSFLCGDLPVPLHAGAEAYYREQGYLR